MRGNCGCRLSPHLPFRYPVVVSRQSCRNGRMRRHNSPRLCPLLRWELRDAGSPSHDACGQGGGVERRSGRHSTPASRRRPDHSPSRRGTRRSVTSRLAALLGIPVAGIDLLFGSLFAAVLEGIACLLWALALRPSSLPVVTEVATVTGSADTTAPTVAAVANGTPPPDPVVAPVTVSHTDAAVSRKTASPRRSGMRNSRVQRNDRRLSSSTSESTDVHLAQTRSRRCSRDRPTDRR